MSAKSTQHDSAQQRAHWYVKCSDGDVGPLTAQQLREMAADGQLVPEDLVSPDNNKWVAAREVRGFAFEQDGQDEAPPGPAGNSDRQQPITFPCSCGGSLRISDKHIGAVVECPRCHKKVTVPSPKPASKPPPLPRPIAAGPSTSSKSDSRPSKIESALRECHNLAKRSNLPFKLREALAIGGWFFMLAAVMTFIWGCILGIIWLTNVTESGQEMSASVRLLIVLGFFLLPVLIFGAVAIGLIWAIVITVRRFTVSSLFDYFITNSNLPYKTPWRLKNLVPPSQRIMAQKFCLLDQLGPSVGNYSTKSLGLGPITEADVNVAGRIATCAVPIAKANQFLSPVATMTLNAVQSRVGDWYIVLPESKDLMSSLNVLRPLPDEPTDEFTISSVREGPYEGLRTCIHCRNRVFLPASGTCPTCKQVNRSRNSQRRI